MSTLAVEPYSDNGAYAVEVVANSLKTANLRYKNLRLWNIYLAFAVKRILKGTSPETLKAMREAYRDFEEKQIEEEHGIFVEDWQ